jgi:hypothetical protein
MLACIKRFVKTTVPVEPLVAAQFDDAIQTPGARQEELAITVGIYHCPKEELKELFVLFGTGTPGETAQAQEFLPTCAGALRGQIEVADSIEKFTVVLAVSGVAGASRTGTPTTRTGAHRFFLQGMCLIIRMSFITH